MTHLWHIVHQLFCSIFPALSDVLRGDRVRFFSIIDFTGRRYIMGKNLVIVGGGAGGPSTAAEAKRRDPSLNVTILERGEFVSFTA